MDPPRPWPVRAADAETHPLFLVHAEQVPAVERLDPVSDHRAVFLRSVPDDAPRSGTGHCTGCRLRGLSIGVLRYEPEHKVPLPDRVVDSVSGGLCGDEIG